MDLKNMLAACTDHYVCDQVDYGNCKSLHRVDLPSDRNRSAFGYCVLLFHGVRNGSRTQANVCRKSDFLFPPTGGGIDDRYPGSFGIVTPTGV